MNFIEAVVKTLDGVNIVGIATEARPSGGIDWQQSPAIVHINLEMAGSGKAFVTC